MGTKNNFNFSNLGYSHEELEFLLGKIEKGFVLSEKDYKLLKDIGIENLSTFSGDFNDLKNKPDVVKQIQDAMAELDIETKANSSNKIKKMSDALMSELSKVDSNATRKIDSAKSEMMTALDNAKSELSNSIKEIEDVIDDSINIAMDEMSVKLDTAEKRIAANSSSINNLQQNLNEVPKDLNVLNNRLNSLETDLADLIANPPKGMTDEERALLNKVAKEAEDKFDDVEVRNKINEETGAITTELVFYSGDTIVKRVEFAGGGGGGGSFEGGTLTTSLPEESQISEKDSVVIPYSFKSPNYGDAIMYVTIVNGASSKEVEYTIKKQGVGSINLGVLTKGINVISMYIVDAFSQMTNIVEVTVVVGGIEITSTFDDGKDFESYNAITIPVNVSPLDPMAEMILNVNIDGKLFTQQVYNGFNNYTLPAEAKTAGVHKISMKVVSSKYESNMLQYSIVIVDRTTVLVSMKEENLQVEVGYNAELKFRVSTTYTSTYNAQYFLNGELYSSGSVDRGENKFTISYRDLQIKNYK